MLFQTDKKEKTQFMTKKTYRRQQILLSGLMALLIDRTALRFSFSRDA